MSDFDAMLNERLFDERKMRRLLRLEKERRGIPSTALAFVGLANVAQQKWCEQQAVLKSRAREMEFFRAYLFDRISYSRSLGLIGTLPRTEKAMLGIGEGISLADIDRLLRDNEAADAARRHALEQLDLKILSEDRTDKGGNRSRLIYPGLSPAEYARSAQDAAKRGIPLVDLESDPIRRGQICQSLYSEKHSSIRWNFRWRHYTIVGCPDGLTPHLAYEYKTTKSRHLLQFMKPVAIAQADLYALLFRRSAIRVQIRIMEESATETIEQKADAGNAEGTLANFARVDEGEPARKPVAWKCKKCEFKAICTLHQQQQRV